MGRTIPSIQNCIGNESKFVVLLFFPKLGLVWKYLFHSYIGPSFLDLLNPVDLSSLSVDPQIETLLLM
jgi:hypothetical protein